MKTAVATESPAPAPRLGAAIPDILYVEDDNLNWLVAQLVIGKECKLTRAANAKQALELLNARSFALILMDIELANSTLDGIELTEVLRGSRSVEGVTIAQLATHPNIPIVFVTAYAGLYSSAQLMARGGSAMISKPIDFPKLMDVLSDLLPK